MPYISPTYFRYYLFILNTPKHRRQHFRDSHRTYTVEIYWNKG